MFLCLAFLRTVLRPACSFFKHLRGDEHPGCSSRGPSPLRGASGAQASKNGNRSLKKLTFSIDPIFLKAVLKAF